jgi:hypothetical protein
LNVTKKGVTAHLHNGFQSLRWRTPHPLGNVPSWRDLDQKEGTAEVTPGPFGVIFSFVLIERIIAHGNVIPVNEMPNGCTTALPNAGSTD